MKRAAATLAILAAVAAALFFYLTAPQRIDAAEMPSGTPDLANGERMFLIGGCASCHSAEGAKGDARLVLSGGRRFATPFGTFLAPNISPGPEGIAGWTAADLATAMKLGVAPDGGHYYPAFPFASYARMELADIRNLKAYLDTLPVSETPSAPHEVGFPFNVRRGLGLWKLLYLDPAPVIAAEGLSPEALAGRYLVEGPGHCGECHTPRDPLGGLDLSQWMAGAKNPEGKGAISNLTPNPGRFGDWSAEEIAYLLETGFKPDFDSIGGSMVEVVENTSRLAAEDRAAIAAYLKALPPLPNGY